MTLDLDFAYRELCPDGACIGIIGHDGLCKRCGTVSPSEVSDPRNRGLAVPAEDEALDQDRALCPDGACVGVIGDDGACKLCGRARAALPPRSPSTTPLPASDTVAIEGAPSDDLSSRELCPDGTCIGVLGDDDRCRLCGVRADALPTHVLPPRAP